MYFWMMKVRNDPSLLFSLPFKRNFMSYNPWHTEIPFPRLLFSPGFIIHTFLTSYPLFLAYSNSRYLFRNTLNYGSSRPFEI
jgi:hypothetical protein